MSRNNALFETTKVHIKSHNQYKKQRKVRAWRAIQVFAVDKRNAGVSAKGIELHEQHHLEENTWYEFHESIVGNDIRKLLS